MKLRFTPRAVADIEGIIKHPARRREHEDA
jgi:plasmid stabilization system protein ParE